MDRETQARMFEPFFTTKDKGKGTGLGLSTVHGIVKQSGGHIRVDSAPGRGTVIRIYLPAVPQVIDELATARIPEAHTGSETILVVEDEPDVRKIVCQLLATGGYKVLEASGPADALALFGQYRGHIDLLLTDVIMPEMNGRELYEQIALLDPAIKILYMSGYTNGVIDDGGILPDGVNFLPKPFLPDALMTTVRRILDRGK
jgi:CheY-like chemotaxis protein